MAVNARPASTVRNETALAEIIVASTESSDFFRATIGLLSAGEYATASPRKSKGQQAKPCLPITPLPESFTAQNCQWAPSASNL
jgi:hypothetical protein